MLGGAPGRVNLALARHMARMIAARWSRWRASSRTIVQVERKVALPCPTWPAINADACDSRWERRLYGSRELAPDLIGVGQDRQETTRARTSPCRPIGLRGRRSTIRSNTRS